MQKKTTKRNQQLFHEVINIPGIGGIKINPSETYFFEIQYLE